MIYILEDNEERIRAFRDAISLIAPRTPFRFWRTAHEMLVDLVDGLEHASLISLDHDLNPSEGDLLDPGTGYDVAKFLGELIPCCPILIHTSNSERGTWMQGVLARSGWRIDRVYPYGDHWIAQDWAPVALRLLQKKP